MVGRVQQEQPAPLMLLAQPRVQVKTEAAIPPGPESMITGADADGSSRSDAGSETNLRDVPLEVSEPWLCIALVCE